MSTKPNMSAWMLSIFSAKSWSTQASRFGDVSRLAARSRPAPAWKAALDCRSNVSRSSPNASFRLAASDSAFSACKRAASQPWKPGTRAHVAYA